LVDAQKSGYNTLIMNTKALKSDFVFWLHLLLVVGAWVMPFLLNWKLALLIYASVMLQFALFGRCLMNEHHGLREDDGRIFYTDLLERAGFRPDPPLVKMLVRRFLYPTLATVTLIWQVWLGHTPLLF
jgi:hypothetical protein